MSHLVWIISLLPILVTSHYPKQCKTVTGKTIWNNSWWIFFLTKWGFYSRNHFRNHCNLRSLQISDIAVYDVNRHIGIIAIYKHKNIAQNLFAKTSEADRYEEPIMCQLSTKLSVIIQSQIFGNHIIKLHAIHSLFASWNHLTLNKPTEVVV